jgi:hypothetical protein
MKSILHRNHWEELRNTIFRFPLANAFALSAFTVISFLNHHSHSEQPEWIYKLLAIILLGLPGFIASELFEEANQIRIRRKWYSKVLMLAYLIWQFYALPNQLQESHIIGLVIKFFILNLLVSFSGYLNKRLVVYFWQFNKNLFFRLLQTVLYAAVLYLGLAGAILAMEKLFLITWPDTIYVDTFFLLVFVFGTLFFTAGIPQSLDAPVFYPSGLKVFVQFVLVPLVLVYILILYGYGIKISLLWELPSGWVANLVLASGVASFLTVLLVWPISTHQENRWTRVFNKWIFKILIPLVGLMILALYQRVNQYGWTEERFLVAIGSAFLLVNCFYFGFWKNKNIKVIPISLALFLGLSVFGPWNIFRLSRKDQVERLKEILSRNHLMENGKWVVARQNNIAEKDLKQIENQLQYLYQHFGTRPFENGFLDEKWLRSWNEKTIKKEGDFVSLAMEHLKLDFNNQIHWSYTDENQLKYARFGNPTKGQLITPKLECIEFGQKSYLLVDSAQKIYSNLMNSEISFSLKKNSKLVLKGKNQSQAIDLHDFANKGWEIKMDEMGEIPEKSLELDGKKIKFQITNLQIQGQKSGKEVMGLTGRIYILED